MNIQWVPSKTIGSSGKQSGILNFPRLTLFIQTYSDQQNPFPNGQPSSLKSGTYPREKILPQYPHFKPPGSIRHEPFRLRQRLSKLPQTSKRTYFGNSPTSGRKYSRHASVTKLRFSQINSSGIGFSPRATSFRGAVPSDQVYGEFDSR